MMTATFKGEEIEAHFTADAEMVDLGVPGSPRWPDVIDGSVKIETLEILGLEVNPKDIPTDLVNAIHALADDVEFEAEDAE